MHAMGLLYALEVEIVSQCFRKLTMRILLFVNFNFVIIFLHFRFLVNPKNGLLEGVLCIPKDGSIMRHAPSMKCSVSYFGK